KITLDPVLEEQLAEFASYRSIVTPLEGQVFIAPMPEAKKAVIARVDQTTADIIIEARRAIVVAVAKGVWSGSGDTFLPIDLQPRDGVYLVRAEGLHDGTVPVMDPVCPVPMLAIHCRMIIGKF